jgi:DNA-binding SARP family transcriptional activator
VQPLYRAWPVSTKSTDAPRLASRLISLTGLITLLAGIPTLLLLSQATPPVGAVLRELAHPGSWTRALENPVAYDTIVRIVALIAWATWAWFAICICLELVAGLRCVPTVRLPASRYAQSLAAAMVSASLALLPVARASPQLRLQTVHVEQTARPRVDLEAATATPFPVNEPASSGFGAPSASDTSGRSLLAPVTDASEPATETYVVQPGDTLWSIAQRELGSPLQWREIAALNMGRPQADGSELTDAHWIYPGWVLLLPVQTASSTAPAPTASVAANAVDPVTSDQSPDTSAPSTVSPRLSADPARSTDPAAPTDESARPLWNIRNPGPPEQQMVDNAARAGIRELRAAEGLGSDLALGHNEKIEPISRRGHGVLRFPIAPIGYGVLGAGVLSILTKLRRAQQRRRPSGLRIVLPEEQLADLEHGLRLGADEDAVEWIDMAQRLLSARIRASTNPQADSIDRLPRMIGVRLRPAVVELLLDPSCAADLPVDPFGLGPNGDSWVLDRDPRLLEEFQRDPIIAGSDAALPSLVTLGRDEYGLLLLDLEHAASVAINGSEADQLAQAMAVEIACSKWSDQVDLVLVGVSPDVEVFDRVVQSPNVASIVQRLDRRVRERKALLDIVRHATNLESRFIEGGDAWDLCVVFCMRSAADAEPEAVNELIELAGEGSFGLVVVACSSGDVVARTRIRADGGPLDFRTGSLEDKHMGSSVVWPQRVDEGVTQGVTSLVRLAQKLEVVPPPLRRFGETTISSQLAHSHDGNLKDSTELDHVQEAEIEVRVLGPVDIVGAAKPFTRAWALELVVYLSFHRRGASTEKWATALWPDRIMAPASLHSTASAARRALGSSSSSGEDHLPRSHGQLLLGSSVATDWDRFVRLSKSDQPDQWRGALELVRGRPFEGLRAYDWALLEGISAMIESEVVDVATRYGELCISHGDASGAEIAARRGLRSSPYDERLYRVLLKAANLKGNPAGVESVMAELIHLVSEGVEPFDAVHPETLELYRSLSRRPVTSRSQ